MKVVIIFILCLLALFVLWLLVGIICALFVDKTKDCKKSEWIYRFYAACIIYIVKHIMRIKLHISGEELLPDRNFLLVGNHRSAFDPILEMGYLSKYNLGFVAKKELFDIPIIGRIMHKRFCLSLDRDNPRSELQTVLKAIETIKSGVASIGIYPEGTRNTTDTLLPFKVGAFKIAQKAECPIVVAVIRNSEKVKDNAPFTRTDVYLDFVGVLDTGFIKQHKTAQISDVVREMIESKLKS